MALRRSLSLLLLMILLAGCARFGPTTTSPSGEPEPTPGDPTDTGPAPEVTPAQGGTGA